MKYLLYLFNLQFISLFYRYKCTLKRQYEDRILQ